MFELTFYFDANCESQKKHIYVCGMGDHQAEVHDYIHGILIKQNNINNSEDILNSLRILRNLCIHGPEVQREITSNLEFQSFLFELLFPKESEKFTEQLQTTGWQLLANMMVNHQLSRELWARYGDQILQYLNADCKLSKSVNVKLMIVYNIMKRSAELIDLLLVMKAILFVWHNIIEQRCSEQFEFLHFIFEEFLVNNGRSTVKCYSRLSTSERLLFLNYLNNYIQQDSPNGLVHSFVMQHVSKEFNIKSDSILRVAKMQEVDEMKPQEAYALLRCIASASGSESYAEIYFKDHSLFLNVSSLLRCLVATTKNGQNVLFSPMNKLEEVAPSSSIPAGYQSEISFELKTLLVRCIANLLYNNDTNKMYCLDTELLPALFECTNMDARNPLMKEWSILAIRNACAGCPEIQQVVGGLSKQGPARNEILTELNLDIGSLRIKPSKE